MFSLFLILLYFYNNCNSPSSYYTHTTVGILDYYWTCWKENIASQPPSSAKQVAVGETLLSSRHTPKQMNENDSLAATTRYTTTTFAAPERKATNVRNWFGLYISFFFSTLWWILLFKIRIKFHKKQKCSDFCFFAWKYSSRVFGIFLEKYFMNKFDGVF